MTAPRDPFDPDNPPPHWVDEDGNFAGWMSEADLAAMETSFDDEVDDKSISLADLLAADDDLIEF